jgi:hypothetical protein
MLKRDNILPSTSQQKTNKQTHKQTKLSAIVTAACVLALHLYITATIGWTANFGETV